MKTVVVLCLLLVLASCSQDTIVEQRTKLSVPIAIDGCHLKAYGVYEKYWLTISAGSFYECSENGVVTSEIITSKMFRGLRKSVYRFAIIVVLNLYLARKGITKEQHDKVISYMDGYESLEYQDVVTGVYDYRSNKIQFYFERMGKRQLIGTYNLDNTEFRIYKNLLKENLGYPNEYK